MNKTTIAGVTISTVKRTHAWWLYLWPFQSKRALLTTLALNAACLPIMAGFGYLIASQAVFQAVIFAAVCGLLCSVYPLLPGTLSLVTPGSPRPALLDLQARLARLGYVASNQPPRPGRYHYRSKRSRFWRWDEQDIELLVHDHKLVLNGPVAILAMLRARLLPPEDFAYLNKKA
jgi:hypothetical protein